MAREKKTTERPVEIRAVGEVVAVEFSGLGDDASPPVDAAPSKGRAPTKPRTRKPPAAPADIPLLPTPAAPIPATTPELSGPAREASTLLESIVRQCRDAQAQLQGELEKRRAVAEEVEAFRQQARAAHEQLLHDAEEARKGAEHVKREHAAAVAQLTATVPETKKLLEQSRGAHETMLRELGEGVAVLKRECAMAAKQVAEAGKQIESLRPQMQGIQESLLYEVELASAGAERVKLERTAAANQLAEAGATFAEARRHFFEGFEQEVAKLQQRLREAGETMQDLPRQAEEVRKRLAEAGGEVRALEQSAGAARQKRETLDLEAARAEEHLAKLRAEVKDAEGWLAGLRLELEEHRRRREAPEPTPVRAEAAPAPAAPAPPPEPETRNHLGITVDHGVVVAEVAPGTPAASAGLIRGDIVTAVNGLPVLSGPELRDLILEEEGGDEIVLSLTRGGLPAEARVRFEVRAEGAPEVPLGATVESGVVVAEVTPDTPGAAAGLLRGDIITAVNGSEVFTGAELRHTVQALAGGSVVTIRYTRAGERREATTRLDEVPVAP